MSQLITINLSKGPGASWGFRLQGGKDFAQPLCIQKVNPGSVAQQAGIQSGDAIVSIGGSDALALRHKEAQDTIKNAGNSFQMVVQRGAMNWRPQVTVLSQPKATPEGPVATQTSLAAQPSEKDRAPKGFNAKPKSFGTVNGQAVVNPAYNTPINLYNEDNIAEALASQSEVLSKGCLGINFRKFDREVKLRTDSPTYQLIHGESGGSQYKPHKQLPPPEDTTRTDMPVFPAAQPGQKGYYNINEKMYCDVHAKQAAKVNPPAPNMVPVTVKPGAAPPKGAVPASSVKPAASNFGPSPVVAGGSSANPAAFGAPSGGIDVRTHIPKKGPAPAPTPAPAPAPAPIFAPSKPTNPAPSFITPKPAAPPASVPFAAPKPVAAPPASAPFVAPKSVAAPPASAPFVAPKPMAAPAPAPAPISSMPKPVPPPAMSGLGGMPKPPGMAGKGMSGQRTAPKRGRGVMTPAHASRIPICAGCQIQIRGPFVTALGKNWCPDHFHCATGTCCKPLIDVGFVEEQGQLFCEDCYEKFLAPTCGKCEKRIKGDCLNAVGKQFCPECFCCAYCGKVFGSGAFYLEDGLPYCETDWNDLFTTKCMGCGFPIEAGDRWVEALNNNFHSQCFKCSKCHKNLEGQSFFAKGGKPYCKSHAQRGF